MHQCINICQNDKKQLSRLCFFNAKLLFEQVRHILMANNGSLTANSSYDNKYSKTAHQCSTSYILHWRLPHSKAEKTLILHWTPYYLTQCCYELTQILAAIVWILENKLKIPINFRLHNQKPTKLCQRKKTNIITL